MYINMYGEWIVIGFLSMGKSSFEIFEYVDKKLNKYWIKPILLYRKEKNVLNMFIFRDTDAPVRKKYRF